MNVLLVDNEQAIQVLRGQIDWKKFDIDGVFTANTIEEAKRLLQINEIDLVFSEIRIPRGNGLDLLEWVKAYSPGIEFVFFTYRCGFDLMRRALQLGCSDYVQKPADSTELERVLSRIGEKISRRHHMESIPTKLVQTLEGERKKSDPVNVVKQYVREHIQEEIYVADIARQVFLNERYLMRAFKNATGMSILKYITNERIWLAKELLANSDYSIRQVANAVGYANYSYFIRMFRQNTGITPKAYRIAHSSNVPEG